MDTKLSELSHELWDTSLPRSPAFMSPLPHQGVVLFDLPADEVVASKVGILKKGKTEKTTGRDMRRDNKCLWESGAIVPFSPALQTMTDRYITCSSQVSQGGLLEQNIWLVRSSKEFIFQIREDAPTLFFILSPKCHKTFQKVSSNQNSKRFSLFSFSHINVTQKSRKRNEHNESCWQNSADEHTNSAILLSLCNWNVTVSSLTGAFILKSRIFKTNN